MHEGWFGNERHTSNLNRHIWNSSIRNPLRNYGSTISVEALQGAGGLLLLLISLELLTGKDSGGDKTKDVNVALVPLGTPLLAGPGAIVTTIVFVQHAYTVEMKLALAAAIVAVHLAIGLTLMFSTKVVGLIKESGVTLIARIAGLLLAAIAVEMIVQSIKGFFEL